MREANSIWVEQTSAAKILAFAQLKKTAQHPFWALNLSLGNTATQYSVLIWVQHAEIKIIIWVIFLD